MAYTDAETFLIAQNTELSDVIKTNGSIHREPRSDYFEALASSIISQQISVKAAAKITERFKAETHYLPEKVFVLSDDQTKAIGLSGQKVKYLRDLSDHFLKDSAVFDHLHTLDDDEVVIELTKVKGIGVWTAQMFLMFTLVRPDIFAPDDRGLQLSIQKLFHLNATPPRSELEAIAEQWKPYRTTASWHLWRSLDNEPI